MEVPKTAPIPGFKLYEASKDGRIWYRSLGITRPSIIRPLKPDKSGRVQLSTYPGQPAKAYLVAPLILSAFTDWHRPQYGPIPRIRYKDGNKRNTALSNLEVVPREQKDPPKYKRKRVIRINGRPHDLHSLHQIHRGDVILGNGHRLASVWVSDATGPENIVIAGIRDYSRPGAPTRWMQAETAEDIRAVIAALGRTRADTRCLERFAATAPKKILRSDLTP